MNSFLLLLLLNHLHMLILHMNFHLMLLLNHLYISNNDGDIKLPCSTPVFTFINSELDYIFSFAYEYINLFVLINLLSKPKFFNFSNNLVCFTLSYSYFKSIDAYYLLIFICFFFYIIKSLC